MFTRFSLRMLRDLGYVGYRKADDDTVAGGGGGDDLAPEPKPKKDKPAPVVKKVELTQEDLDAKIAAARDEERAALAAERKKEKDDADRADAEKKGEFQKLAEKERADREAADDRAAAAERRAQLAEVNVSLRDHLAKEHPEYLANAADIMLHVEKGLKADAKPADVRKLITDEAKAFVERTPRGRVSPPPAPIGNRQPAANDTRQPANGRMTITGAASHF